MYVFVTLALKPASLCLVRCILGQHFALAGNGMSPFTKIHERRSPPGLETRLLRRMPLIVLLGSLVPLALAALVRILPTQPGVDAAKHIKTVDIFAIATELTFLTAVLTVTIGCIVVHIMKGPAYVWDAYPVEHSDKPETDRRD